MAQLLFGFLDRALPAEELSDEPSHLGIIRLERKVTRIQDAIAGLGQIALREPRHNNSRDLVYILVAPAGPRTPDRVSTYRD